MAAVPGKGPEGSFTELVPVVVYKQLRLVISFSRNVCRMSTFLRCIEKSEVPYPVRVESGARLAFALAINRKGCTNHSIWCTAYVGTSSSGLSKQRAQCVARLS